MATYDTPVVYGWLENGGKGFGGKNVTLFKFDCRECGRTHTHGWVDDIHATSHRSAHCPADSNSKYHATGYYIALDELAKQGK